MSTHIYNMDELKDLEKKCKIYMAVAHAHATEFYRNNPAVSEEQFYRTTLAIAYVLASKGNCLMDSDEPPPNKRPRVR